MRLIIILLAAVLLFLQSVSATDDAGASRVSEKCGEWVVSFDWPIFENYSKSIAHSDSESGKVKVFTDTLTMTGISEPSKVVKITITTYSVRDASLVNSSSLMDLSNKTLYKSGVCGDITANNHTIDGRPGVLVSGTKCSDGGGVDVAAYPVDYFFDKPGRTLESNAVAVIASTMEQETTERLIGSIHIEQAA